MNIVVIDDSMTNLIVLKSLSANVGNATSCGFSDPDTAVEYLSQNAANAIVLDYSMPKVNGVQLIEKIRLMPHHKGTPIVMVTHATDQETRMCALRAGASAFLSKPVNANDFKTLIKNLLENQNQDIVVGMPN